MAEKKKKKGFLSKLGFKSKADKLAEEAAAKAAAQQLVDEKMAARMAAINAAALASAREQDESAQDLSAEETAAREAEEKRLAEIQAARDVARAKQLAEEKIRKEKEAVEEKARLEAEAEKRAQEAAAREAEEARLAAEADAKRAAEEKARLEAEAEETARIKAEEAAALAQAKSEAEAAALKAKQEAEALAREEARLAEDAQRKADEAAQAEAERLDRERIEAERIEAEKLAEEKAQAERLKREAEEADRRARIAEEQASREIAEREAEEAAAVKRAADRAAAGLPEEKPAAEEPLAKGGFFNRITSGLRKSTSRMSEQVGSAFTKRKLDDEAIEELEDILVMSDLGYGVATKVTDKLREDKFDKQVTDLEVKIALADVISEILTPLERPIVFGMAKPQIMLFVGVNGSGKTTTLGKMAKSYTDKGKKVLIAAGDTFRAAAVEQLTVWGERANAPVMSASQNADAAGLVFDAIQRARDEDVDILMIDTAGRLQNRSELMEELSKIIRVIRKQDATAPHHSILVLDATVGQNALTQTEVFKDTADVTGLIMTKLDGTAKGGVLVALSDKYGLPIHHIGIGERIQDLENFSAPVFAAALSGVADALES